MALSEGLQNWINNRPSTPQGQIDVGGYLQARPDLQANWDNNPEIQQAYGSIDNYATDDFFRASNGPQRYANLVKSPDTNATDAATSLATSGTSNTPPTPVTTSAPLDKPAQATVDTGGNPTNFNNTQNANQFGQYQNQSDTTGVQFGTTGSKTTGTTDSTTTSTPLDTLGFGALLQGQQGAASADDATRRGFLTDLVNTGGSAEASQLDQGIRNSLTGAQMTGAGDSSRARAAGYAAAQVSRNNTDQRLAAAGQLAGPTAVEGLSTAANPYIGNTSTTHGTNSSDTSGFSNLVSNSHETGSGTATGFSSQAAAGLAPQTQTTQSGSGGCVLCTAAIELGLSKHHRVLRTVIAHKLGKGWPKFRNAARGYFFLFTPLARVLLGHPRVARVLWPLAKAVVYEELRVAGRQLPPRMWAQAVHWSGHYLCAFAGRFLRLPGYVTDPVILSIARREQIIFEVQS